MPAPELIDLSLLILADLGVRHTRNKQRVNTLTSNPQGGDFEKPPAALKALESSCLATLQRTDSGYKVHVTDKGLALHRHMMALLKQAATELPLPASVQPSSTTVNNGQQ